jgi:hypothetical protein
MDIQAIRSWCACRTMNGYQRCHRNTICTITLCIHIMIESGFWIFIVEAVIAGALFAGLIWWVVKGTSAKDRAKMEEARRKAKVQDNGEVRENDERGDS